MAVEELEHNEVFHDYIKRIEICAHPNRRAARGYLRLTQVNQSAVRIMFLLRMQRISRGNIEDTDKIEILRELVDDAGSGTLQNVL